MLLKDVASTQVTCPHYGTVQMSARHPVCRTCGRRLDRSTAPSPAGSTARPPVAGSPRSSFPASDRLAVGLLVSAGVVSVALVGLFVAGYYVIIPGGLAAAGAARIFTPAGSPLRARIPGLVELFWAATAAVAFISGMNPHLQMYLHLNGYLILFMVGGPLSSAIVWALGRGSPIGLAICGLRYVAMFALVALGLALFAATSDGKECELTAALDCGTGFVAGYVLLGLIVLIPAVSGVALIAWPRPQQRAPAR